ncbi:MAG TPA: hypothetical protein VJ825_10690 [Gemmatimonadaceae bacterium]|nr:hypothetical protein [Gemmatimonadaceae bacterium]
MSVKRFLVPSEYSPGDSWRLVEWCRSLGADEFTVDMLGADPAQAGSLHAQFGRAATAYARPQAKRERMSGKTADALVRDTEVWALNEDTIGILRHAFPAGIFQYDPRDGGWFEDPILYREGELMLGVLSHEAFAVLRVSERESAQLAAAGFPSHASLPRFS